MEMAVSFIPLRRYMSLESHVDATLRLRFIFNAIMTFIVAGAGYLMVRHSFLFALIISLHSAHGPPFQVPHSPGTTKIFWMSEEDNRIALRRMQRAQRLPSSVSPDSGAIMRYIWLTALSLVGIARQSYNWNLLRRIFKNPITYVFVFAYA
jgi:hypothetical protein